MSDENETKTKAIEFSHFGVITLNGDGTGSIDSGLLDDRGDDWEEDPFHAAIDALLGLVVRHAIAGIDVTSRGYERGFEQQVADLVEAEGEGEDE